MAAEQNVTNISLNRKDHSQSWEREVRLMDMPRFDNSPQAPAIQARRYGKPMDEMKWREVMKFMKNNPSVMLDMMPPTPRRKNQNQNQPQSKRPAKQAIPQPAKQQYFPPILTNHINSHVGTRSQSPEFNQLEDLRKPKQNFNPFQMAYNAPPTRPATSKVTNQRYRPVLPSAIGQSHIEQTRNSAQTRTSMENKPVVNIRPNSTTSIFSQKSKRTNIKSILPFNITDSNAQRFSPVLRIKDSEIISGEVEQSSVGEFFVNENSQRLPLTQPKSGRVTSHRTRQQASQSQQNFNKIKSVYDNVINPAKKLPPRGPSNTSKKIGKTNENQVNRKNLLQAYDNYAGPRKNKDFDVPDYEGQERDSLPQIISKANSIISKLDSEVNVGLPPSAITSNTTHDFYTKNEGANRPFAKKIVQTLKSSSLHLSKPSRDYQGSSIPHTLDQNSKKSQNGDSQTNQLDDMQIYQLRQKMSNWPQIQHNDSQTLLQGALNNSIDLGQKSCNLQAKTAGPKTDLQQIDQMLQESRNITKEIQNKQMQQFVASRAPVDNTVQPGSSANRLNPATFLGGMSGLKQNSQTMTSQNIKGKKKARNVKNNSKSPANEQKAKADGRSKKQIKHEKRLEKLQMLRNNMKVRSPHNGPPQKLNSDINELNYFTKANIDKNVKSNKSKEDKPIVFLLATEKSMLDNMEATEDELSPKNPRIRQSRRVSNVKKSVLLNFPKSIPEIKHSNSQQSLQDYQQLQRRSSIEIHSSEPSQSRNSMKQILVITHQSSNKRAQTALTKKKQLKSQSMSYSPKRSANKKRRIENHDLNPLLYQLTVKRVGSPKHKGKKRSNEKYKALPSVKSQKRSTIRKIRSSQVEKAEIINLQQINNSGSVWNASEKHFSTVTTILIDQPLNHNLTLEYTPKILRNVTTKSFKKKRNKSSIEVYDINVNGKNTKVKSTTLASLLRGKTKSKEKSVHVKSDANDQSHALSAQNLKANEFEFPTGSSVSLKDAAQQSSKSNQKKDEDDRFPQFQKQLISQLAKVQQEIMSMAVDTAVEKVMQSQILQQLHNLPMNQKNEGQTNENTTILNSARMKIHCMHAESQTDDLPQNDEQTHEVIVTEPPKKQILSSRAHPDIKPTINKIANEEFSQSAHALFGQNNPFYQHAFATRSNDTSENGQQAALQEQKSIKAHFPVQPIKKSDVPYDWTKTNLFKQAMTTERLLKPNLNDQSEKRIISLISQMRVSPQNYQKAHVLMPIFEVAVNYLEEILINQLDLVPLFVKIKQKFKMIDFQNTLKLLVRTRICAQIKQDMFIIDCRYLDFLELVKIIQQLRDEYATDELIRNQLNKLQQHGVKLIIRAKNFINDYKNTFKTETLNFGGKCVISEVTEILRTFGILLEDYEQLAKDESPDRNQQIKKVLPETCHDHLDKIQSHHHKERSHEEEKSEASKHKHNHSSKHNNRKSPINNNLPQSPTKQAQQRVPSNSPRSQILAKPKAQLEIQTQPTAPLIEINSRGSPGRKQPKLRMKD